jgi:heat shock protein HslJ
MFKYLAILILSAGASTCNQAQTEETKNNPIVEKSSIPQDPIQLHDIWALREITGTVVDTSSFPAGVPRLEIFIKEMRISGFSGCNNYFASIDSLDANTIQIGDIAATKKYCMGVKEKVYLAALAKSKTYKIEKLHLFLYENDSLLLTFRKVD